ncbi:winged helix-turn-helix domain-containing protein [Dokdonia sp.]|uniref:winged helix-turn-helix domain-containing protein n=1 Tax=Dokdonia sp. TaxID=2024995 RepID=UPI003264CAF1
MSRIKTYSFITVIILLILAWFLFEPNEDESQFPERAKIAIREIGNQLLLANNDTTSLVSPVIEVEDLKYKLSFENMLAILPDSLVSISKRSLDKAGLPKEYLVEVIDCTDKEVAYSYGIFNETAKDIIPCSGRFLPRNCYALEVIFTKKETSFINKQVPIYLLILSVIIFLGTLFYKKRFSQEHKEKGGTYTSIGHFQFYPEQNKLVREAVEIGLSKKECELLAIFVANPNQVIKRDELTKKVWEDNGVIVGRSLDTYISKLRKILKDDDTIKITNVHGVGYKLEINR